MIEAIVAVYGDWGIGADGTQPVVVSADRKHFREVTDGSAVICGRKTLEDFPGGRPLKNRVNIVLTRQALEIDGAVVVHSPEEALAEAAQYDRVFVIGGASTYSELFPHIDKIFVTKLDCVPHSDVFFPDLDENPDWEILEESTAQTDENGVSYRFLTYGRRLSPELQDALNWIRGTDPLTRMGAGTSILRRSAELHWLGENGLLLSDSVSGIWYAYGEGAAHLPERDWSDVLFITDSAAAADYLRKNHGKSGSAEYYQVVYPFAAAPAASRPARLRLCAPTDGEMVKIDATYALADMEELQHDRKRGNLFAAHDDSGSFVGYMGIHSDGSMGLLEVFPEYRRLGYAEELECFMIRKVLSRGLIPYAQIAPDNAASMGLQQKLGFLCAPATVWYVW